jgi:hypothetical protein
MPQVTQSTNTHYDKNLRDWLLIDKMLTGDRVKTTLVRGAFEAQRAFDKRKERADWKPYTRDLVSRLSGELFSRVGEVSRETAATDEYLASVGPEGESYHVQLIQLAETLLAFHDAWAIMDPAQGLQIVEPQHVPRWNQNAVVLKGTRTVGGDVFTDEAEEEAWTVYYSDRFETYVQREDENGNVIERLVDEGFYVEEGWEFSQGPPAVRFCLPWTVKFGLAVAKAHRALFRMESKFDEALTNSLGGLVQIATAGDDELKQQIEKALKRGAVAIPYDKDAGEHKPLNIGTGGLGPGQNALERKRKELYRSAHQALDQASSRMTATEANARTRSGQAAALSVLAETMQSAEESILPVVAEAEDRRNAGRELNPEASWPTDYSHAFDRSDEELVRDIFGKLKMPVDDETAADVVVSRLQGEGFSPDREQILDELRRQRDREAQQQSASGFNIS